MSPHRLTTVWRAALWGVAAVLLSTSCLRGPIPGPPPRIEFVLSTTPDLNSCGKKRGEVLYYRILQVTDASRLATATPKMVWDREGTVLGEALLKDSQGRAYAEGMVEPDTAGVHVSVPRIGTAKQVVFLGYFCSTHGTCWYLARPLPAKGSMTVKVIADSSCVRDAPPDGAGSTR